MGKLSEKLGEYRAALDKTIHGIHGTVHEHSPPKVSPPPSTQKVMATGDRPSRIHNPTPLEILRYRYHHGTNLGSIFVLEKWLHPSMFPADAANNQSSELAAVTVSVQQIGLEATRSRFEEHWKNAVSTADFDWLVNTAHCTSIRLPIGYFTLGPTYCEHTSFAPVAQVYANAWSAVRTFVFRARARGIGVLIDLHALPGGANTGDHSGTNSGKAELWNNHTNLKLAQQCLTFIAQEIKTMDGVIGLQLCNEAIYDAPGMYGWYDTVMAAIGSTDQTIPIYISDAWNLPIALSYTHAKNNLKSGAANPVIIDTHLYWAFTDADKAKSPQQIIAEASDTLKDLDGKDGNVLDNGAVQVVVGEYSCVLTDDSWTKRGDADREQLVKEFGQAQSKRYQQRAGGSFFWTFKMDWMDGGEWGFVAQTNAGAVTAPANLMLTHDDVHDRIVRAKGMQEKLCQGAVQAHCEYWNRTAPGQQFEHWRYEDGWTVGYRDAVAFFGARADGKLAGLGGDKIGCFDIWVRKRIAESGMAGAFVWEFEQGFRRGVGDFYEVAGV